VRLQRSDQRRRILNRPFVRELALSIILDRFAEELGRQIDGRPLLCPQRQLDPFLDGFWTPLGDSVSNKVTLSFLRSVRLDEAGAPGLSSAGDPPAVHVLRLARPQPGRPQGLVCERRGDRAFSRLAQSTPASPASLPVILGERGHRIISEKPSGKT